MKTFFQFEKRRYSSETDSKLARFDYQKISSVVMAEANYFTYIELKLNKQVF